MFDELWPFEQWHEVVLHCREERMRLISSTLDPLPITQRLTAFQGIAGRLCHAECVWASIRYNIFGYDVDRQVGEFSDSIAWLYK